jgi:hypothetical protein
LSTKAFRSCSFAAGLLASQPAEMDNNSYFDDGDGSVPINTTPQKRRFIRDKHLLHPDIIFKSNHISVRTYGLCAVPCKNHR